MNVLMNAAAVTTSMRSYPITTCWRSAYRLGAISSLLWLNFFMLSQSLLAQRITPIAPVRPALAIAGEPFGVMVLEIPVPPGQTLEQFRVLLHDDEDRIFYPATSVRSVEVAEVAPVLSGRLRPGGLIDRVRSAIRGENTHRVPVAVTVAALFRGNAPLSVHLVGDINQRLTLTPTVGASAANVAGANHGTLLSEWWRIYGEQVERVERGGDHPLLMHKYLAHMLALRFNLPWPQIEQDPLDARHPQPKKLVEPLGTLALLSGIEPLRDEILEQTLMQPVGDVTANLPAPVAPTWLPPSLPAVPPDVAIESLATRVPADCFYLRFGSFANYLWFQDLSARNGGDLAQIVLVRGFNYETSRRMERMLNTRLTALAKMFGDQIIDDMAIIGSDLYMKEGASLGALFATKNRGLLMSSMNSERRQAIGKIPGATMQTVEIAGKDVSFLSTPDNRVRSFLVADGDYVLLTTSRHLVERFLQTGAGELSLASLDGFRWARQWMPEANAYSVFGYFSPEFFHSIVAPQYQIELRRRLEAIAHIELAEVAARAAVAEGINADVPGMIAAGLLPPWFEQRADGARTLRLDDRWIDSLRGARGSFLPIVDVDVGTVSASEAERYTKLAGFYETKWQQMDPMLVGLRRFQGEGDPRAERIGIEAYLAPFAREKYGWVANMLAPAAPLAVATPTDDVISVQMLMNGTAPLTADREPYHLFAGVKDMAPPSPGDTQGLIQTFRALKATPGYLGAYPRPGYLDQLPLGIGAGRPDYMGISRSIIGLYRWQDAGFSVLSFDRSIVEHTRAALAPIKVEDSAQVRLNVRNLAGSQLSGWINQQWYERASRASHGNAALLDALHQQLKVPGPEALSVAETMLDVRLNCPLGGTFSFVPHADATGKGWWTSSAWANEVMLPDGRAAPPADYVAPWLRWFRTAQLHLTQFSNRVAVVGTLDVQRQTPSVETGESESALPPLSFDLFQLPFKMFGSGEAEPPKPQKRSF